METGPATPSAKTPQKPKTSRQDLLIFLVMIGSMLVAGTGLDISNLRTVQNWPSTEAIIEGCTVHPYELNEFGDPKTYILEVRYLYEVDGTLYRGIRPELRAVSSYSEKAAQARAKQKFKVGSKAIAYYDPEGRLGSYLIRGEAPVIVPYFFGAGIALLIASVALCLWWKQSLLSLFASAVMAALMTLFFFGSSTEPLEADEEVSSSWDLRAPLEQIGEAPSPKKEDWKALQPGMSLTETITLVGRPALVTLEKPGKLVLEFSDRNAHRLLFEADESPHYRLSHVSGNIKKTGDVPRAKP
jgi:hypothetical protein